MARSADEEKRFPTPISARAKSFEPGLSAVSDRALEVTDGNEKIKYEPGENGAWLLESRARSQTGIARPSFDSAIAGTSSRPNYQPFRY